LVTFSLSESTLTACSDSENSDITNSLHRKHDDWWTSNADVHILGFSHAQFRLLGLSREFVLFDEFPVWKQGLMQLSG